MNQKEIEEFGRELLFKNVGTAEIVLQKLVFLGVIKSFTVNLVEPVYVTIETLDDLILMIG